MKITPAGEQVQASQGPSPAQLARDRAISMLTSQPTPVQTQGQLAVEDMSAVQAQGQNPQVETEATESQELSQEDQVHQRNEEKKAADEKITNQYAILARKEKQFRQKQIQQEQSIKAKEEAILAKEQAILAKEKEYQQGYISKDQLKKDTLRILADTGISYDDLTQQILNQGTTDPRVEAHIARLEAKIAQLEENGESAKKSHADQQAQAYQAAVKQIKLDTKQLVNSDPSFETIKATNSVNDVVELITQTYDKYGKLLSVEEACQQVEDYLVEEAMKLTKIEKIKRQLNPSTSNKAEEVVQKTEPKQQTPMKTLTNAVSSSRKLTSKERAILAFKGELKS